MTPLKPWKSFDDQLTGLKARGLHVDDDAAALSYLARIGYYRLSGYWYPLRVIDKAASESAGRPVRLDEFIAGSRFEDVVKLYVFDKKLRLLALDALERIEMAVRVDVAHLLGRQDPCAHENPDCLHGNFSKRLIRNGKDAGKTLHRAWLEKHQQLLHRARREPFVQHHQEAYDGRLPIWVAIEVWDFGQLSKLFAGMRFEDQAVIAARYGATDGRAFANWLRTLNFMRNVAAHHSRMWNINVLEPSPVPEGWPAMPNTRTFFCFCLMQQLLRTICPRSSWGRRLVQLLEQEFPQMPNRAVTLADMGIFEGWNWNGWELWPQK
ncbi:Abi family protein [Thermomonas sp.]|uniref:Abi family protein n=1 Tax=Thermomonas sp. TaxID=1971895 RepID=UPI0035AE223B